MKEMKNRIYFANFTISDIYDNNYDYVLVSNYLMKQEEVKKNIQLFTEFDLNFGKNYFIIQKEAYESVLKPTFDEIKSMLIEEENKMEINLETYTPKAEINGWELTDDDSLQYLKKINPMEYECIQLAPYPTDDLCSEEDEGIEYFQVCQANIDVMYYAKYKAKTLMNILASYNYCDYPTDDRFITYDDINKIIANILEEYGEKGYQLIAECAFEDIPFYDISIFKGTEEECIGFIETYCEKF